MAWFNTDWNIANMFNSPYGNVNTSDNPYGFTGGGGGKMIVPWSNSVTGQTWDAPNTGYQPPNSDWQMVNSQKGTLGGQNSVWGAPAYYQEPTGMFGNNPYQSQDGGFYNPYQFGQVDYPYQYGGNNTNQQEQPWWMNYNTDNSIVNPPNIPTTSVDPMDQGKYVGNPNHGGTGPGGKDLTHAETIKYFGLYDDAEKAFAAGDKQAAYRKDHMHWRAGTGAWAGNGKQEGQSDLDYPGRTTANGDVIMGDRQKLGDWSNMGNNIQNYFKAKQMFNETANDQGGNDYTANNVAGTITTNDGTTIEVKPADDPYWNRNNNIFESKTKDKSTLNPTANQSYLDDSQNYSPSVTQTNNNAGMKWNQGAFDGYKQLRFNQPILGKNLGTGEYEAQFNFNNPFGKTDGWNLGRPGDPNYVPFVPTYNQTNNNNLVGTNKSEIDYAKEYNYQPSNWSQQINENIATPATGNSFYDWQRELANKTKGKLSDLGSNIFNMIIPKAEGAEINDGGNYLSRDITAGMNRGMNDFMNRGNNLQEMFDAQEAIQKRDNIFNQHFDRNQAEYTPSLSDYYPNATPMQLAGSGSTLSGEKLNTRHPAYQAGLDRVANESENIFQNQGVDADAYQRALEKDRYQTQINNPTADFSGTMKNYGSGFESHEPQAKLSGVSSATPMQLAGSGSTLSGDQLNTRHPAYQAMLDRQANEAENLFQTQDTGFPAPATQKKLGFAESAALKAATQAKNWVNMGLSPEKAAELAKMSWSDANKLEKKQAFNPKYAKADAVSRANYLRQGVGSLVGQNAVPGSNVGGGTALTQKLFQNPFVKAITSNPYAARAATGLGLLGTAGMAYGAFDAGKGVANYAIDKLGVRDDLKSVGSNIAKSVQARKVAAENIKKEKDEGTFQPRVTAPAKKAAAEKKVVKKATPKRVTVNYNKNKPVAVKSKPTRTPAPKVTRTTGSRGGRGNVAKKKATKKYTSKGGW